MGFSSNINLFQCDTLFSMAKQVSENKMYRDWYELGIAALIVLAVCLILGWFLNTSLGLSIRATGDNAHMVKASSINPGRMITVGLLSGGQRQALTLLMATVVTPKILLLDEHTAALDPATAEKVMKLTKDIIAERGITCLMVTHNMHQALETGNRTLMMNDGRIILDVSGRERENMTVDDLLEKFRAQAGAGLDNDRILLSGR